MRVVRLPDIGFVMFTFNISVAAYFSNISFRLIRATLSIFASRVGEEGIAKIFAYSVNTAWRKTQHLSSKAYFFLYFNGRDAFATYSMT